MIYLGSTPCDEECAQVGTNDYANRATKECQVYRRQILRLLETCPYEDRINTSIRIITQSHDFGSYYEVVINDTEAGYWIEENISSTWDDISLNELKGNTTQ